MEHCFKGETKKYAGRGKRKAAAEDLCFPLFTSAGNIYAWMSLEKDGINNVVPGTGDGPATPPDGLDVRRCAGGRPDRPPRSPCGSAEVLKVDLARGATPTLRDR